MLINAIVPAILLPAGLLLARLMPLQTAQRERTRIVTTIQDGQLGWLALAWSAATVYEAWDMDAKGHVFRWVAVLRAKRNRRGSDSNVRRGWRRGDCRHLDESINEAKRVYKRSIHVRDAISLRRT